MEEQNNQFPPTSDDIPAFPTEPAKEIPSEAETPAQNVNIPSEDNTPPYIPQKPKKKKGNGWVVALVICLCLTCICIGAAGVYFGGQWLLNKPDSGLPHNSATVPTQADDGKTTILESNRPETDVNVENVTPDQLLTPAQVYAANVNSTVGITTSVTTNYWGQQTTSAASGSGFILSADGYILTNHHVIEDSDSITVSFYDGTSVNATLIGSDASNDIAVLKADATGLTPVVLGNSSNMHVGDSVAAIGNPLGELTFSLTTGIISALDREVTMSNGIVMNLIQTDCAINSGNSGGALFNMYGEVVGITNAKYSYSSGGVTIDNIGFAIPINQVRSIVQSIIEKGYASKPYLGVSVIDVSYEMMMYGLPQGAAIHQIVEGGPAQKAGLQVNDIITKINDTAILDRYDVIQFLNKSSVGDKVTVTVYRRGVTKEITVTIGESKQ